jgi:hypothetical protein
MDKIKKTIVLASVAKDICSSFLTDYKIVMDAFRDFEVVQWIVVESNSGDNSATFLLDFAKRHPVIKVISLGTDDKQVMRTTSIAKARNRYLSEFLDICKHTTIDNLVVIDLNELNKKLNRTAVLSCFKRNDWAAVCANQSGPYYDIYALRHDSWSPNDCWLSYSQMRKVYNQKLKMFWDKALWHSVYSRMIKIKKSSEWIQVHSAFGGVAIYDSGFLADSRYNGETDAGDAVCEHVSFNLGIEKAGGKIFINPEFINFATTNHSLRKRYFVLFNSLFYLRKLLLR